MIRLLKAPVLVMLVTLPALAAAEERWLTLPEFAPSDTGYAPVNGIHILRGVRHRRSDPADPWRLGSADV